MSTAASGENSIARHESGDNTKTTLVFDAWLSLALNGGDRPNSEPKFHFLTKNARSIQRRLVEILRNYMWLLKQELTFEPLSLVDQRNNHMVR